MKIMIHFKVSVNKNKINYGKWIQIVIFVNNRLIEHLKIKLQSAILIIVFIKHYVYIVNQQLIQKI